MKVTYPIVKNIFDTLPIGYYLGRNISVELSETSTVSAFYPFQDKIIISYPIIANAFNAAKADVKESEIEPTIRGLFYHEISHVIFTSKSLFRSNKLENDVINIFEDERIETICKDVYMNVDFKRTLVILNGGVPTAKSALTAFYNLVRYRIGEQVWIDKVDSLIRRYNTLTAISDSSLVVSYGNDVISFYKEFAKQFDMSNDGSDSDSDSSESSNSSSSGNSSSCKSNEDMSSNDTNNDASNNTMANTSSTNDELKDDASNTTSTSNTDDKSKDDATDADNAENTGNADNVDSTDGVNNVDLEKLLDAINKKVTSDMAIDKSEFAKLATKRFNEFFDSSLDVKMSTIINNKLKQNKQNGSAINAYSGRLNPRAVGTRDDYRWWTQQNRDGHVRQYNKVHFNLYIDNSGSFWQNDTAMNIFIQTLDRIAVQNPNFTFDVITINTKIVEWPNHHLEFNSDGGNKLTHAIAHVIRRHQKPACNNYNIVLFDGDAHSDDQYGYGTHMPDEPFTHFDTTNTIIITDNSNKRYLEKANMCNAVIRYCKNYCDTFINVICDLLNVVI